MMNQKTDRNSCEGCFAFRRSFMCSLNERHRRELKENSIHLSFRKGQNIIIRQADSQGLFCIRSGTAKFYLNAKQSNITVGLRTSGEMFGHHELLGKETIFSVGCLTDVEVCFFPKKNVLSRFARTASFSNRIVAGLNSDMAETGNYLLSLSSKSIKQRTAQAILYLKEKTGVSKDGTIGIKLNKQELADMVGASRESVFRELSFLKKKKWIATVDQDIHILDEELLSKTSE